MATYREIHGKPIKSLSTDPSVSTDEGQIWYNTTSNTFKSMVGLEAWSSAAALNVAREGTTGFGLQTAALCAGGETTVAVGTTDEYNGTGWVAKTAMNTANRALAGAGIVTAGVVFGGFASATNTEEWDGSAWTASGTLNEGRNSLAGLGVQTSALAAGGQPGVKDNAESYNGSTWTAETALSTARVGAAGGGASDTAAVVFGGYTSSPPTVPTGATEEWDGSSWTAGGALNTARYALAGTGTLTATLAFSGQAAPGRSDSTESYDGSSWTTSPATLATARSGLGGAGTTSAALAFGGTTPPISYLTEEFNKSVTVYTGAAYSSVANMPGARAAEGAGSKNGTKTAAMNWCGGPGFSNTSVEFNGTSWSATPNYPETARHVGGTGVEPAALGVGGFTGPANLNTVAEYDGSSWTGGGAYPVSQYSVATAGTQTAAITAGGGSNTTTSNDYDGSSWTANPSMSSGRSFAGNAGTQTATIAMGGSNQPAGECEEFDGSSWTSGGNLASGYVGESTATGGTQTAGMMCGANAAPGGAAGSAGYLQTYDGTSWITDASLGEPRSNAAVSGTTNSNLAAGGYGPGAAYNNAAEEYNVGSTALNVKTLTQS